MKKIYILGIISVFLSGNMVAQKIWDGGGADNNFSTANNWDDDIAPAGGENYLFNATSTKSCNVDVGISATSFSIMAGYTSVIDMGSIGHVITGDLVVNAGTLIATTGILEIQVGSGLTSAFSLGGGGTFIQNTGGSIDLYMGSSSNFAFSGNIVLKTLNILFIGGATTSRIIDFGSNLTTDDLIYSSIGSRIYSFQGTVHIKNSLDLGNSSHTTTLTSNTGTFVFDGSSASIIGSTSTGAGKAYLPNIQINTTGAYTITRSINLLGNWAGSQGTLTVGTSTVNMYGTSASITGTAAAFDNLTIQSGATVALPANAEVKVGGNLTRTGTLNFQSTTSLGLNQQSGTQSINLGGLSIAGLRAYNSGTGRTVTLSGGFSILNVLEVQTNVTLNTGGSLTLTATNALSARVASVGGTISGNITVETLIPGGATGWANLGVSGVQAQTVASWDTYVSSAGATGIPMTCQGCSFGVTGIGSYFESIQGWNETANTYDTTLTSASTLTPGIGFWVYVGSGQTTSTDLKLRNTGAIVTGSLLVPTTVNSSGFNLVANPYPSPIEWNLVINLGSNINVVNDAIYAFSADNGATSYVNGIADNPAPNGIDNIIPAGQGFYVENANIGFFDLEFDESIKSNANTSANPLIKPAATSNIGQTFRLKLSGITDHDGMVFRIHPNATAFYDKRYDARKLFQSPGYLGYPGIYDKYTTISSKDAFDEDYSIHSIPPLTQSLSVPVLVRVSSSGSYTISAYDFNDFTACLTLHDKLTDTYHNLRQSDYVFTISDTTSTPRFDLLLCRDETVNPTSIFEQTSSSSILIGQDQQGAFVRTAFTKNTKTTISVYNIIGQKLMDDISVEGTATTTRLDLNLPNQVVLIRVVSDKESSTKKMVLR